MRARCVGMAKRHVTIARNWSPWRPAAPSRSWRLPSRRDRSRRPPRRMAGSRAPALTRPRRAQDPQGTSPLTMDGGADERRRARPTPIDAPWRRRRWRGYALRRSIPHRTSSRKASTLAHPPSTTTSSSRTSRRSAPASQPSAIRSFTRASPLQVRIDGDHGRVGRLVVSLDDGAVYTAPANFKADDWQDDLRPRARPGRHAITVDVERKDDRNDGFRNASARDSPSRSRATGARVCRSGSATTRTWARTSRATRAAATISGYG